MSDSLAPHTAVYALRPTLTVQDTRGISFFRTTHVGGVGAAIDTIPRSTPTAPTVAARSRASSQVSMLGGAAQTLLAA